MTSNGIQLDWKHGSLLKFAGELELLEQRVHDNLESAMDDAVLKVQADAARLVNVDTGRLRASIASEVSSRDPLIGEIGSNVEYAPA